MLYLNEKNIADVSGGNRCACCDGYGTWFAEVGNVDWDMGKCYKHCCGDNGDRAKSYGWTANDNYAAPYKTSSC